MAASTWLLLLVVCCFYVSYRFANPCSFRYIDTFYTVPRIRSVSETLKTKIKHHNRSVARGRLSRYTLSQKNYRLLLCLLLLVAGDVEPNPGPPHSNCLGSSSRLSCVLFNARSIVNKVLDLQVMINSSDLDIVIITETYLDSCILDSEIINTNKYTIFRHDRNRHGGGVMIIVRDGISVINRSDLEVPDCELFWIEVFDKYSSFLLGVFYRPPSSGAPPLAKLYDSLLSVPFSKPLVLCGDFNLPLINWPIQSDFMPSSNEYGLFLDLIHERSLLQLVEHPTRCENILDLILCNQPFLVSNIEVSDSLPRCDHDAVFFQLNCCRSKLCSHGRLSYNFKKANFDLFRNLLDAIDWSEYFIGCDGNINKAWAMFKDVLFKTADQCIPKSIIRPKKGLYWLSRETLKLVHKKRGIYRLAIRSSNPDHFRKYRRISNMVRKATRFDHKLHLESITSNLHNDQRAFWRWLKNARKKSSNISCLRFNNTIICSPVKISDSFNQYFSSVFTSENISNLSVLDSDLKSSSNIDSIVFDANDVYNELCELNPLKACGPDGIPGRLLLEGAPWLCDPIYDLFQMSFSSSTLLDDWKCANITPVHKKGDKHLPHNYRPISLTCLVVKCFEHIIHSQITDFLEDHHKLCGTQHGFRPGHSCQTQLLSTIHSWAKSMDNRNSVHAIFLDFSKAFDSVPHQRLLLKVSCIGIRGKLLEWIKNFLVNRKQRVIFNGSQSGWKPVLSGVPQGSILGPLLFLVYINDIHQNLSSPVSLFSDDCTLYHEISSSQDCFCLQADLDLVSRWSVIWQLPLNLSKCKALSISNKLNPISFDYTINNVTIEWVSKFTYLGIIINKTLSWKVHAISTKAKAFNVLNILRRSLRNCSKDAKLRAYNAIVRPCLEYCCPVWLPHQSTIICDLEKVQKCAARWILGVK